MPTTLTLELTEEELFTLSQWALLAAHHATVTEDLRPALSLSEKVSRLFEQLPARTPVRARS